jgi:hypothetical protein
MEARSPIPNEPLSLKKLNRVTLALSPENEISKNLNQLPKVNKTPKSKQVLRLPNETSPKSTYSVAYIGDISGVFSISVKKSLIPKLSRRQISEGSRGRMFSPHYQLDSSFERRKHQYFRPKPLTPASIKLFDFSDYRHKSTSIYKSVRSKIIGQIL